MQVRYRQSISIKTLYSPIKGLVSIDCRIPDLDKNYRHYVLPTPDKSYTNRFKVDVILIVALHASATHDGSGQHPQGICRVFVQLQLSNYVI